MTTDEMPDFLSALVTLAEQFRQTLSASQQARYFDTLRDLPLDALDRAITAASGACSFFPQPVELRAFAQGGTDDDLTEGAWMALRRAMPVLGYVASVSVRDAALGEAILAVFGSWPGACLAEFSPEMWASKRKEFGRVYRVLRSRGLTGGRYLVGATEQQNAGRRDWLRFVPVGRIEGDGTVQHLTFAEAEVERQTLAAVASEAGRLHATFGERL
jgi:hypothetical protein